MWKLADEQRIGELIAEIGESQPELAAALRAYAQGFDYESIVGLLQVKTDQPT